MPGRSNAKLQSANVGDGYFVFGYQLRPGFPKLVVHSYEISAVLQMLMEVG